MVDISTPNIRRFFVVGGLTRFAHPMARSREWVMLGAISGAFSFGLDEDPTHTCAAGEFVLCPPGVRFSRTVTQPPLAFYYFEFGWKAPAGGWRGVHALRDVARLETTVHHLRTVFDQPERPRAMTWKRHLLRDLLEQTAFERGAPTSAESAPDRLMWKAAQRLRGRVEEEFSLAELAAELQISPSQLSRRFRVAFAVNPQAYRSRARLARARELLLESDWTLERIAAACGLHNGPYLSRLFRAQFGQAPGAFRRAHRV